MVFVVDVVLDDVLVDDVVVAVVPVDVDVLGVVDGCVIAVKPEVSMENGVLPCEDTGDEMDGDDSGLDDDTGDDDEAAELAADGEGGIDTGTTLGGGTLAPDIPLLHAAVSASTEQIPTISGARRRAGRLSAFAAMT